MLKGEIVLDYDTFRTARVAVFVDVSDARRAGTALARDGESIERLARMFSARVLMVEKEELSLERILEEDLAEAWLLLVAEGGNKSLSTRRYPQRINLDAKGDWYQHAVREIIRQVKETRHIHAEVVGHYSRYALGRPTSSSEEARPRIF